MADPYGYFAAAAGREAVSYVLRKGINYAMSDVMVTNRRGTIIGKRKHRKMGPDFVGRGDPGAGYHQLYYVRPDRIGARLSKRAVALRALEAQLLTKIDRWQNVNANGLAGNGALELSAYTAGNWQYHPFYLFDLTSLEKNIKDPVNGYYRWSYPMQRLQRDTSATGDLNRWRWVTQASDGGVPGVTWGVSTDPSIWSLERAPYLNTSSTNVPYEKCFLNWADIRIAMTGATAFPSSVEIGICHFTDEARMPPARFIEQTSAGAGTVYAMYDDAGAADEDYAEYSRFWQSIVDDCAVNPLMTRGTGGDRHGWKILHRKKFDFQPTMTTENDSLGHQKIYKLFYNMGEVKNYRTPKESAAGDVVPAASQFNPQKFASENVARGECNVLPQHTTARKFLYINFFVSKSSSFSSNSPIFDIMVSLKVTLI